MPLNVICLQYSDTCSILKKLTIKRRLIMFLYFCYVVQSFSLFYSDFGTKSTQTQKISVFTVLPESAEAQTNDRNFEQRYIGCLKCLWPEYPLLRQKYPVPHFFPFILFIINLSQQSSLIISAYYLLHIFKSVGHKLYIILPLDLKILWTKITA